MQIYAVVSARLGAPERTPSSRKMRSYGACSRFTACECLRRLDLNARVTRAGQTGASRREPMALDVIREHEQRDHLELADARIALQKLLPNAARRARVEARPLELCTSEPAFGAFTQRSTQPSTPGEREATLLRLPGTRRQASTCGIHQQRL